MNALSINRWLGFLVLKGRFIKALGETQGWPAVRIRALTGRFMQRTACHHPMAF